MLLAINTAFLTANLALQTDDCNLLKDIDSKSKHSENVLNTIDTMCIEANVNINQLDTLAVVVGPGSFTGLRIGTAIAQALGCVNKNLKFLALSSLELMSYIVVKNKLCERDFVCVINALSNLFFVCKFNKEGIKISQEQMIDKSALDIVNLPKFALQNDLYDEMFTFIKFDSQSLLDYANLKAQQNAYVPLEKMLPVYLRASQAEDNLLKKSKKDL